MTYRLLLAPQVVRFLRRCPQQQRIHARFDLLKDDPFRYVERLEGYDCFKLRIGDYRAIVDIDSEIVRVRYLDHRSRVYKRFR